jgi:hypothetical protein
LPEAHPLSDASQPAENDPMSDMRYEGRDVYVGGRLQRIPGSGGWQNQPYHDHPIIAMVCSPDKRTTVSFDRGGKMWMWSEGKPLASGSCPPPPDDNSTTALLAVTDGGVLVAAASGRTVWICVRDGSYGSGLIEKRDTVSLPDAVTSMQWLLEGRLTILRVTMGEGTGIIHRDGTWRLRRE